MHHSFFDEALKKSKGVIFKILLLENYIRWTRFQLKTPSISIDTISFVPPFVSPPGQANPNQVPTEVHFSIFPNKFKKNIHHITLFGIYFDVDVLSLLFQHFFLRTTLFAKKMLPGIVRMDLCFQGCVKCHFSGFLTVIAIIPHVDLFLRVRATKSGG